MVPVSQIDINEAVMIAKNATYKLAYELTLEQRYGGNIDCCITKLKLLWMYEQALSCQVETATWDDKEGNCLTNEVAKKLIAKIKSMCNIN